MEIAKQAQLALAPIIARLQREFPEITMQVASGKLEVFRTSVQVGLRKEPMKRTWNEGQLPERPIHAQVLSLLARLRLHIVTATAEYGI